MKEDILEPKQYKKKGSSRFMQVVPNKKMNDPKAYPDWFIDVSFYTNVSKTLKDCSTIIKSDLKTHMTMYLREGWEETDYVNISIQKDETNNKS
jgi:hypothetical protein|tara:strand:+ start:180 stop:461 length:282 start_codon:yes stop_codon:yes gene_type:complete